ncbi:MAG: hypothetical protein R3C31_02340 [Hyphomonadaceae bacterium]
MAGVVFVFVREDSSEVEALAEAFEDAGYSITSGNRADLYVVVWSRSALRSEILRAAAQDVLRTGCAVVAALFAPPTRGEASGAPIIDLSQWDGVDLDALAPLLEAADDILHPIEANVIVLPSRPAYEDAEFTDAPLLIASNAWEAPLPTATPRAVREPPAAAPKLGAPNPRRDFRRAGARRQQGRAYAALAFAVIAILGGGAFVASVATDAASYFNDAGQAKVEIGGGVSLTSATADAIGVEDLTPETPAQVGHRGVEPPSARTVRRAS